MVSAGPIKPQQSQADNEITPIKVTLEALGSPGSSESFSSESLGDRSLSVDRGSAMDESVKFLINVPISLSSRVYDSAESARVSPLAAKLFGFPWVKRVEIYPNAVAVTKVDWVEWEVLVDPLSGLIEEHLQLRQQSHNSIEENPEINVRSSHVVADSSPVTSEVEFKTSPSVSANNSHGELGQQILAFIDEEVNPSVASHGGHVLLEGVKDLRVYLRFEGGCQGCAMSYQTLKDGIEKSLRSQFPEILEVIDITDHQAGDNPYFT